MKFEMLKDKSSIIKVIGVGGGGGNAVNHMYKPWSSAQFPTKCSWAPASPKDAARAHCRK
jgi:hypothetical protein